MLFVLSFNPDNHIAFVPIYFVSFAILFFVLRSKKGMYEIEADAFAIKNGADPKALESALKKIQEHTPGFRRRFFGLDEATFAKRIVAIQKKTYN